MQGLALVDYDNLIKYRNESMADVEIRTEDIIEVLARTFRNAFPGLRELDVRFYGGWTDELGATSPSAVRLLQILPALRGRRHGLIIRPSLALTMLQFPEWVLRGTVRLHTRRRRQKMVDGMIGGDAMFRAAYGRVGIGIVTDDDDLVPAALSANAANPGRTVWIRRRAAHSRLNDHHMTSQGLRIYSIQENSDAWRR